MEGCFVKGLSTRLLLRACAHEHLFWGGSWFAERTLRSGPLGSIPIGREGDIKELCGVIVCVFDANAALMRCLLCAWMHVFGEVVWITHVAVVVNPHGVVTSHHHELCLTGIRSGLTWGLVGVNRV